MRNRFPVAAPPNGVASRCRDVHGHTPGEIDFALGGRAACDERDAHPRRWPPRMPIYTNQSRYTAWREPTWDPAIDEQDGIRPASLTGLSHEPLVARCGVKVRPMNEDVLEK